MPGSYLRVTIRTVVRHKGYSFINVTGLAVGMAAFLLILLFVRQEMSYDRYHKHAADIYRITVDMRVGDQPRVLGALSSAALAPNLKRLVPEVIAAARVRKEEEETVVRVNQHTFMEKSVVWADQDVFSIFSLPFLRGDPESSLTRPNTVVMTERVAQKYFGADDPIAKSLVINGVTYEVSGVIDDLPENTHLRFDFLASLETDKIDEHNFMAYWANHNFYTYLRVHGGSQELVTRKLAEIVEQNLGEAMKQVGGKLAYFLQPITDIHLHSHLEWEFSPNGDIIYVVAYCIIAVLILSVACFNFTNLAMARGVQRAREIGVRKVFGARRGQLMWQLIGESVFLSLIAMVVSVALVELSLTLFRDLIGVDLLINYRVDLLIMFGVLTTGLLSGMLSGIYPAVVLSRLEPANVLKANAATISKRSWLTNALVVIQFVISSGLIVVTLIVASQLDFMLNKPLGFNRESLIAITTPKEQSQDDFALFRSELLKDPRIEGITACSALPGFVLSKSILQVRNSEKAWTTSGLWVDYDFLEVMEMKIVSGRNFSRERGTDSRKACLINESLARRLGGNILIGKEIISAGGGDEVATEVIGIVQDFNFHPLRTAIQPLFIAMRENEVWNTSELRRVVIRVGADYGEVIKFIEQKWREIYTNGPPFEFAYVDDRLQTLYMTEQRLGKIFRTFASLAIFIACLGLLGLVSYTTQARTREIGVRKVLGASTTRITMMLVRGYTILVLVATVISWPVAYMFADRWLEEFAYRITIGPYFFIFGGVVILLIVWFTVAFHAIRAAFMNPTTALRYE